MKQFNILILLGTAVLFVGTGGKFSKVFVVHEINTKELFDLCLLIHLLCILDIGNLGLKIVIGVFIDNIIHAKL
jgi:hypothetical protein